MDIPRDFYSSGWMTFGKMKPHDFKQPESKFDDKDCCADKHHKPHHGKLDVTA